MTFVKGNTIRNSGRTRFKKGSVPAHKGTHVLLNTGKTHFKKGHIPWNWKGGISFEPDYYSHKTSVRVRKINTNGGKHTSAQWQALKEHFLFTCPSCRRKEPEIKLTKDHMYPVSLGGGDEIDNIQPLCGPCNSRKFLDTRVYLVVGGEFY